MTDQLPGYSKAKQLWHDSWKRAVLTDEELKRILEGDSDFEDSDSDFLPSCSDPENSESSDEEECEIPTASVELIVSVGNINETNNNSDQPNSTVFGTLKFWCTDFNLTENSGILCIPNGSSPMDFLTCSLAIHFLNIVLNKHLHNWIVSFQCKRTFSNYRLERFKWIRVNQIYCLISSYGYH